jgi:hypothetical protein
MLLASRTLPTYTDPSVSVVCPEAGNYEVGTTVTPSYSAEFENGKY